MAFIHLGSPIASAKVLGSSFPFFLHSQQWQCSDPIFEELFDLRKEVFLV
jgi:hypothetical protein